MSITIRNTPDGAFDEIFARDAYVHVEVMARHEDTDGEYSHLWLVIESNGKRVTLNVTSDAELKYTCEAEDAPEVP